MSTSRHTLDMTVGSPAKLLFRFSLPLFLGNLLQQLYHLVDTAMAGHMLGDAALSQIGSTAALYSLITTLAFGLNSGFALTVSRHFGSGNKESMERSVCWMILLSALCALVMTAVFFSARAWLVDAMQIPADIRDGTLCYLTVILAGIPLSMAYNLESNMMQSVGNSVTPLFFLLFSCMLNVVLDYLFMGPLGLGVGARLRRPSFRKASVRCSVFSTSSAASRTFIFIATLCASRTASYRICS